MAPGPSRRWKFPMDPTEVREKLSAEGWSHAVLHRSSPTDGDREESAINGDVMYVVIKGTVKMSVSGSIRTLQEGDEFLVPQNVPHMVTGGVEGAEWMMARRTQSSGTANQLVVSQSASSTASRTVHPQVTFQEPYSGSSRMQVSAQTASISTPRTTSQQVVAQAPPRYVTPATALIPGQRSMVSYEPVEPQRHPQPPVSEAYRKLALEAFHALPTGSQPVNPQRIVQNKYISLSDVPSPRPYVEMQRIKLGEDHNRDLLGARLRVQKDGEKERLVVSMITGGGPAHVAGISVQDEIASWNGVEVTSLKHFCELVKDAHEGQVVRVGLLTPPASTHPYRYLQHIRTVILSHQIAPYDPPAGASNNLKGMPKYAAPLHR